VTVIVGKRDEKRRFGGLVDWASAVEKKLFKRREKLERL
jgi:hypothetical protein